MYLAISAVAAMCAALAAVQTRNAKRLGADLRQKTVEAESFQLNARTMEQRLHTEEAARMQLADRITKIALTDPATNAQVETALRESEDTACRLRGQLHTATEKLEEVSAAYRRCYNDLYTARTEVDALKSARRKLEEALIAEREAAAHWQERFQREQAYRLSTEGRIMREVNNLLCYDGTAHGQEDLSDE